MRHAFIALLLALTVTSAGCNSTTEGAPQQETSAPPKHAAIDFSTLDVGPYPTEAQKPLGVAGSPGRGVVVEAQRMANHVLGPWDIDPEVTEWFGFGAAALPTADSLSTIGPEVFAAVAARNNFINGFASARAQKDTKRLLNVVLRFANDESATAATAAFGAAALQQKGTDGPAQKLAVPGHDATQASSYTTRDRGSSVWHAVRTFTAHGPYVLMQLAQSADGLDQATELVVKSIDAQSSEIDKFRATDPSEFADISIDPDGLLARTVPIDGPTEPAMNAVYEPQGALHFQNDPVRTGKLFSDTGTDLVSMAKTNVYETKDADGAKGVVEGFFTELQSMGTPVDPVKNMPDSRCLQLKEGSFYCLAPADKYAIEVHAKNLLEVQQLIAAQYVMLMR